MNGTTFAAAAASSMTWKSSLILWSAIAAIVAIILAFVVWRKRKQAWPVLLGLAKHPFAKYVTLSVIVHLALAAWILTSQLFAPPPGPGPRAVFVRIGADVGNQNKMSTPETKPWDAPVNEAVPAPQPEFSTQDTEASVVERPAVSVDEMADATPIADLAITSTMNNSPAPFAAENDNRFTNSQPFPAPQTRTFEPAPNFTAAEKDPAEVAQAIPEPDSRFSQADPEPQPEPLDPLPEIPERQDRFSQNEFQQSTERSEQPKPIQEVTENRFTDIPKAADTFTPDLAKPQEAIDVPLENDSRLATIPASSQTKPLIQSQDLANTIAQAPAPPMRADGKALPAIYRDRWAADRLSIARARGGSENTERAVQAALRWIASVQADDGRWDASQFDSGRPTFEGGHDRRGAGIDADTGTTGLAILAFLGSGHTHAEGEYAEVVRRGLDYLVSAQQSDGNLYGNATTFAAMYCHGIATLAMSEAYSLTGDAQLLIPVQNGVRYTLKMQHPVTGGWRYRRGQEGDTSQLGWQLMALTSAHYAGLQIPRDTWIKSSRFLRSVTSYDGRAAYRPRQAPSVAMTAEAMLCKLFLRTPTSDPKIRSAAQYIVSSPPGRGRVNYYYWYYGTLALYHLQDENWLRWNTAVKRTLVARQDSDGSWDADSVWGTSGGKVYSTALAALTLEVYYRYRPLAAPNVPASTTRQSERTAWQRD